MLKRAFENSFRKIIQIGANTRCSHTNYITANICTYIVNKHTIQGPCQQPQFVGGYQILRHYAKGKDKMKEKGKAKVAVNEAQLSEIIDLNNLKTQMEKGVSVLKEEYLKQVTLRSSSGALESIIVNFEGKNRTLQELAQIVRKNPKTVIVNMAVFPQAIPDVMKAIQKSGMNLNPQQDGTTLYIPTPPVTKEYRQNLAKSAKMLFVKCKDHIRDVQNKCFKGLKKKEGISTDLIKNVELQIIAIADQYILEAQKIFESKQTELIGDS
ncbi:hypothetical protein FQA39_LY15182 [Lamprigera yunnana]|nr:hypothetical protein FQA39_LY15182 [Lamprigera yunnana]